MQILIFVFILLSLNSSFAESQKIKPTKCLFTSSAGKKSLAGMELSELCSEMNVKGQRRILGVCLFDKVWQRGYWDPGKKGRARFTITRVCDRGVEYATVSEDAMPFGPHFFKEGDLLTIDRNFHNSNLQSSDPQLSGKVPASCFTQHDPTTLASSLAVSCSSDILAPNFCELKNLSNYPAFWKKLNGNWWVQYTNPTARTFRICVGGVTLVKANPDVDPVYEKISNTDPVPEGDAKICLRKEGNTLKEFVCKPGTAVGSCLIGPNSLLRNNWKTTVFNYVKSKYGAQKTFHASRTNSQLQPNSLTFEQVQKWVPTKDEDIEFLNTENEKLDVKRWVQIKTVGTDIVDCEEVVIAKPRT